jgi:hypothetical protein
MPSLHGRLSALRTLALIRIHLIQNVKGMPMAEPFEFTSSKSTAKPLDSDGAIQRLAEEIGRALGAALAKVPPPRAADDADDLVDPADATLTSK